EAGRSVAESPFYLSPMLPVRRVPTPSPRERYGRRPFILVRDYVFSDTDCEVQPLADRFRPDPAQVRDFLERESAAQESFIDQLLEPSCPVGPDVARLVGLPASAGEFHPQMLCFRLREESQLLG